MILHRHFFQIKKQIRLTATCALLALAAVSYAQLPPLGEETLIHPPTATFENEPAVAMDAVGNYAVAYTHHDGTNAGINIQRFNRDGTANGPAIMPMVSTAGVQQDASIAMANDGRFVVVWEDNTARGGNNFDAKYALYDADGSSVIKGTVNTTLTGVRENVRVSMNRETGEFVVVFAGGADQLYVDVYYRRFSAAGVPLDANEIRVNTGATQTTSLPSVALAENGNFIVAWEADSDGNDFWEATFQRYTFGTTAATAQGGNVIASAAGHDTTNVEVACDDEGNFVLAWVDGLPSSHLDPNDLLFRIYDASGSAAGAPQVLKAAAYSNNGDTLIPRIRLTMDDDRDFVSVYLHNDEIYARYFTATGSAVGAEVHVNTTTDPNPAASEYQTKPAIAMNPAGNRLTAVWAGTGETDNGIHKQRYAAANVAPVFSPIDDQRGPELSELTFTVTATEVPENFGDTITYSLPTAPAGASIDPVTGLFSWTPTEDQGPFVYTFPVRATDDGEPVMFTEETLTVAIDEVNQPPTDLALAGNTVVSGSPAGTVVGTLSASDADLPVQPLTFTLVDGTGSDDNASFQISGNELQVAVPPSYSTKPSMSVRVQADDGNGGTIQSAFTITVEIPASVDDWSMYQ